MGDIKCARCGEPWDSYGVRHGDMEPDESEKFLAGKGCPSCGFATRCTECRGTGKIELEHHCEVCGGTNKILGWSAAKVTGHGYQDGRWYFGYSPNVKVVPENAKFLRAERGHQSLDGFVQQKWFRCWACDAEPCPRCKGTGKFVQRGEDKSELFAITKKLNGNDCDGQDADLEDLSL
jgi:RecJ-like exonuclease